MKRILLIIALFALGCTPQQEKVTEADKEEAIAAIEGILKAFADFNYESLRTYVTEDFHVIEDGKIYKNIDEFLGYLRSFEGSTIENSLNVHETFFDVNSALVIIDFTANVTMSNGEKAELQGIESHYLVKKNGKWLIQFYHSTYY